MMTDAVREPHAVGARLRMLRPELTALENRILDAVLDPGFDETTPLRAVSEAAGVSDPMVVKTAKKLGFEGFRDFREQVSAYHSLPSAGLHKEISPGDSPSDILAKVFNTAIHALGETLAILDVASFAAAVDAIHAADRRDLYGVGGSAQIARDVAHKFLRIGLHASVHDDAHMMLMSASLLEPGDVAVAFSHSGRSSAIVDAAAEARRRGARTIAVTNYAGSPLASASDIVLCSTARGSPLLGENAAARVAQLSILDAVFAAVAQKDLARAERNLVRTTEAVQARRTR